MVGRKEAARAHLLRRKLEATKSREESEESEEHEDLMKIEENESEGGNEEPELHKGSTYRGLRGLVVVQLS